jgi:hypothetical protein
MYVEVGDAVNVRLSAAGPAGRVVVVGGGGGGGAEAWVQVATGAPLDAAYAPLILVRIDAARLRDPIRAAADE